ncbi:MAG TPA: KGG domain-containing protein [Candidatus Paceibacterota bacterium]|jgi:Stress-induced bacterial acidophilic repeat motif.
MADEMNRDNNQDNKNKGGGNPGNFANDPERAREAGRKGGQA